MPPRDILFTEVMVRGRLMFGRGHSRTPVWSCKSMGPGLYRKRRRKTWLRVSCHSTIHCKISHLYYLSFLKTRQHPRYTIIDTILSNGTDRHDCHKFHVHRIRLDTTFTVVKSYYDLPLTKIMPYALLLQRLPVTPFLFEDGKWCWLYLFD